MLRSNSFNASYTESCISKMFLHFKKYLLSEPSIFTFCQTKEVITVERRQHKLLFWNQKCQKNGQRLFNPLSANPTKWSNTLKQFVGKCRHMAKHTCGVHTARFLKYVWPFINIMNKSYRKICCNSIQFVEIGLYSNCKNEALKGLNFHKTCME